MSDTWSFLKVNRIWEHYMEKSAGIFHALEVTRRSQSGWLQLGIVFVGQGWVI